MPSTTSRRHLFPLPPELIELVVSHVPLYATPSAVLALALVNRQLFGYLQPILHRHLILVAPEPSVSVLKRITESPGLGRRVQGIYLKSARRAAHDEREDKIEDPLKALKTAISGGKLPFLKRLEVFFEASDITESGSRGQLNTLEVDLWDLAKEGCPGLRSFAVSGWSGATADYPRRRPGFWGSHVWQLENLSNVTLHYPPDYLSAFDLTEMAKSIASVAHRLEHLDICHNLLIDPFLDLTFPVLRSLAFRDFRFSQSAGSSSETAMAFWRRHPTLESLVLAYDHNMYATNESMFTPEAASGDELPFLPNVQHLEVPSKEIRHLIGIVKQLKTLTIHFDGDETPLVYYSLLELPLLQSLSTDLPVHGLLRMLLKRSPQLQKFAWMGTDPIFHLSNIDLFQESFLQCHRALQYIAFPCSPRWLETKLGSEDAREVGEMARDLAKGFPSLVAVQDGGYPGEGCFNCARIMRDSGGKVERVVLEPQQYWIPEGRENYPFKEEFKAERGMDD